MQDLVQPPELDDRQRHALLQSGLDLLEQGFTLFDTQLRLVAWNRTFFRMLEFPEELARVGVPFEAFMRYNAQRGEYGPGDVEELVRQRVEKALAFEPHCLERKRPGGQFIEVRGVPLPHDGFITLYTDITARRRYDTARRWYERRIRKQNAELESRVAERTAELQATNQRLIEAGEANRQVAAALRRSDERLRLITDAVPALIAYFDRHEVYGYANKGYADWFGRSKESIVGNSIREVAGEDVYASVAGHVARSLQGHRVGYEYSMRRPDGRTLHARSELVPEIAPDGQVLGCFVMSLDVTELKQAQAALLNAQKMEAVGQLAGGLAHDFNNTLTVITGSLGLLRNRRPDAAEVEEFVLPAINAAQRGAALIKRLLAFTCQQPIDLQPVDVGALIGDTTVLLRRTLPETIGIETSIAGQSLHALGDLHQLENAILNLALNARDAMPDGGHLRIEAAPVVLDAGQASAYDLNAGDYVAVAVADSGSGMDQATLARAFEPFFTTKSFGSGSGLGLSMVYGFVKQSGGGVAIRSAPAEGTTVTLVLRRCAPAVTAQPAATSVAPAFGNAPAEGPLVLLVEDDLDVRQVVIRQLVDLNYSVLEAADGVDALDLLDSVRDVEFLISDVVMPAGIDGRTLCREARRRHPLIRSLLISGYVANDPAAGRHDDAQALLRKPFTSADLQSALEGLSR